MMHPVILCQFERVSLYKKGAGLSVSRNVMGICGQLFFFIIE